MRRMMRRVDARSGCPDGHAAASCIRHGDPPGVADSSAQVCAATGQTGDPWRIRLWRGQVDLLHSGGCCLALSCATSHYFLILYEIL